MHEHDDNEIFLFRQLGDYGNDKEDDEEEEEEEDNEEESEEQILLSEYCQFIAKYTLKLYGLKQVNAFYASTQGTKTVFDLVTPSDEAYALFVFMNGYHYWKERVNETKQDKLRKTKEQGKKL